MNILVYVLWLFFQEIYVCIYIYRERDLNSRLSVDIFPLDCTSVSFDLCYNGREIDYRYSKE